jgi:hypothetical protein
MSREQSDKLIPFGFNLTVSTKEQFCKIAGFLHTKKTDTVIKLFELLFSELVNDEKFKAFLDAYDRIGRMREDKSVYTTFYISKKYLNRFEDVMFGFDFIERSSFLRLILDYVYNHNVKPVAENLIPKVKNDFEGLGYKIDRIIPMFDRKVCVIIENPAKGSGKRKTWT